MIWRLIVLIEAVIILALAITVNHQNRPRQLSVEVGRPCRSGDLVTLHHAGELNQMWGCIGAQWVTVMKAGQ